MKKVYHHDLPQPIGLWMTMRGPSLRKLSRTKEVWSATKSCEAAINKHIQTLVAIHAIWSYDDGALCPRKDSGQRSSTFAFTNALMLESFATRFWGLRLMAAMSLRLELAHKNHAISKTSLSCPFCWTTGFHPNLVGTFVIHVRLEMMSAMSSRLWASRRRALAPSSHEET